MTPAPTPPPAAVEAMDNLLRNTPWLTPQPAHDHGATGFCTDHGQAPDGCDADCGVYVPCTHKRDCIADGARPTAPDERTEWPQSVFPSVPGTATVALEDLPDERTETVTRVLHEHRLNFGTDDNGECCQAGDWTEGNGDVALEDHLAAAVVAALGDESARLRRERDAARVTIHRMDSATISALRATGVWEDNLGVVSSIRALAAGRDAARDESARLREEADDTAREVGILTDRLVDASRESALGRAALDRVRALADRMTRTRAGVQRRFAARLCAALDDEEPPR